jgi:opacity protein-like surface antigen
MKRTLTILALAAFAAAPVAAQLAGMPVWNNPKGGTGVTISGDLGIPNADYGKGTAFGARGEIGLGNLNIGAGLSSWKPNGATSSLTSLGATAGFRVIGGSLLPVAINLQGGAGRASRSSGPSLTTFLFGAGISVNVPTPGLSIEPYLSISNRWHKVQNVAGTQSNIGWVLGANVGLGMMGLHIAYDSEKDDLGFNNGVLGIGLHFSLKAPIGM